MERRYKGYPAWMIVISNLVPASIYVIGAAILSEFRLWVAVVYLLFCLWLEVRVMRKSCADCYYYGKNCGAGKGRLCALLFKRGDPRRFAAKEATWKDILPDFLVSLLPLAGGIVLSFLRFSWFRIFLLILLVVLAFGGTAVIRRNLLCRYCKQSHLGCPAAKLFEKNQS